MPHPPHCRNRQRGVTLVEMIIVAVVLGILSVLGSTIFVDTFKLSRIVNAGQANADQARYALERLAREYREIKYDRVAGTYSITSVASPASSASFTNSLNGADQAVTIDFTDGNLRLGYGTPTVLCSNVTAFTLNYLDVNGAAATSVSNVRFVVMNLTVTDSTTSGQSITQRLRVGFRNS